LVPANAPQSALEASRLPPPEVLEAVRGHLGVSDRVLDILVPEIVLQRSRVMAIVGQLEPTSMPKHVRVDWKWHLGSLSEALDEPVPASPPAGGIPKTLFAAGLKPQ
jgi:hypothetical protein